MRSARKRQRSVEACAGSRLAGGGDVEREDAFEAVIGSAVVTKLDSARAGGKRGVVVTSLAERAVPEGWSTMRATNDFVVVLGRAEDAFFCLGIVTTVIFAANTAVCGAVTCGEMESFPLLFDDACGGTLHSVIRPGLSKLGVTVLSTTADVAGTCQPTCRTTRTTVQRAESPDLFLRSTKWFVCHVYHLRGSGKGELLSQSMLVKQ
jgi:hypothetical protein